MPVEIFLKSGVVCTSVSFMAYLFFAQCCCFGRLFKLYDICRNVSSWEEKQTTQYVTLQMTRRLVKLKQVNCAVTDMSSSNLNVNGYYLRVVSFQKGNFLLFNNSKNIPYLL